MPYIKPIVKQKPPQSVATPAYTTRVSPPASFKPPVMTVPMVNPVTPVVTPIVTPLVTPIFNPQLPTFNLPQTELHVIEGFAPHMPIFNPPIVPPVTPPVNPPIVGGGGGTGGGGGDSTGADTSVGDDNAVSGYDNTNEQEFFDESVQSNGQQEVQIGNIIGDDHDVLSEDLEEKTEMEVPPMVEESPNYDTGQVFYATGNEETTPEKPKQRENEVLASMGLKGITNGDIALVAGLVIGVIFLRVAFKKSKI